MILDLLATLIPILSRIAPRLTHLVRGSLPPSPSVRESSLDPTKTGISSLGCSNRLASMKEGKETVSID
jgi:hypothetical protein